MTIVLPFPCTEVKPLNRNEIWRERVEVELIVSIDNTQVVDSTWGQKREKRENGESLYNSVQFPVLVLVLFLVAPKEKAPEPRGAGRQNCSSVEYEVLLPREREATWNGFSRTERDLHECDGRCNGNEDKLADYDNPNNCHGVHSAIPPFT